MRTHPIVTSTRQRRIALTLLVALAMVLTLGIGAIMRMPSAPSAKTSSSSHPSQARGELGAVDPQLPPEQAKAADDEADRLRHSPSVPSRISSGRTRIAGATSLQPDLYAAAFVKELLNQDYTTPREHVLSWVQAEAATTTEPRVVGLIPPELRPKWAVFSVTDGPTPPIPTAADWISLGLRHGRTTVQIQRVIEPVPWSTAVASGEISDPSVTAREVTALVTLSTTAAGVEQKTVASVDLSMDLEGPPARPSWGFVGAVTYDAVSVGRP